MPVNFSNQQIAPGEHIKRNINERSSQDFVIIVSDVACSHWESINVTKQTILFTIIGVILNEVASLASM